MSLDLKLTSSRDQQDIIDLFNRLIIKSAPVTGHKALVALLNDECSAIDSEHQLNEKVRVVLEKRLESIPDESIDASALLTEGPFKGKSLLWVCAYIAASIYGYHTEDDTYIEGYRYILGKLFDKAIPATLQFNTSFTLNTTAISTIWLTMYAHLKSLNNDDDWIFDYLLKNLSQDDLLKLNLNDLEIDHERNGVSALGLLIKADNRITQNKKATHRNYVHRLLTKVSPIMHPQFYNFNGYVVDRENLGMTTLCLAARGDADHIRRTAISEHSPFISILRTADITQLNFKAKILKGPNKGKSPFWYAACMLDEDEGCYQLIDENADFSQLDFNDKAEDPTDKDANKSALWFVSHDYAENSESHYVETVFRQVKNLTQLDYNNSPANSKDPNRGKTVLWNLGKAALNGRPKPFTIALNQGNYCDHNYAARACSDEHADKSVLGFALALALKGNLKPLNIILRNIKKFKLNPEAIGPFELEMLCHLAKNNHLYPLEILLPTVKMTPQLLNRVSTVDKSDKSICFLLIELAWAGYPQFLKMALKDINCDELVWSKRLKTAQTQSIMKEMSMIVRDVSRHEMPIFREFISSSQEDLIEQLAQLRLDGSSKADISDYQDLTEPLARLTAKFEQLKLSAPKNAQMQQNTASSVPKVRKMK